MAEWKEYTVADVISTVIDYRGKTPKKLGGDWSDSGYRALYAKNIKTGKIVQPDSIRYVSEDMYRCWMKEEIQKEDILITSEAPFGQIYYWDSDEKIVLSQRLFAVRINQQFYPKYIYFYMTSSFFQTELDGRATGTTVVGLRQPELLKCKIFAPDYQEQKRIADTLWCLEQKINNNEAINNNLEQQAKALFKSWFIDFEPFGGVQPPEMKFVPLQELCKVVTKGTTPTTLGKPFTSSGINFIKAESILDSHSIDSSKFAFIDEETNALLKRSVIKANDIVFTIAGTLGRFAMVDNSVLPANTNQAVAIIRPDENKVTPAYLYSFFIGNWHNEYYSKRIQQAVQANLSLTTIKSLPIAVLSKTTMNNYDELVSPLFALMKGNEEENRRLSELRDTLLPKLMSGELDVSNIDL